jgi:carbonic anhydrase
MVHICDAIVVCCIDFRFQKYIRDWTNKKLKNKTFDMVGFAGSTKDLKTVMNQIDISVNLHHTKEVYLIHHEECGAYGKESTYQKHKKDLKKAKNKVLQKHPNLKVYLYYLYLNGKFEKID